MKPATISSISLHLGRSLGGADADARLAAMLACQATQDGHVCADLAIDMGWGPWAAEFDAERRAALIARLPQLAIVGGPEDWTPLLWDGRRLYLRRYWDYEHQVATALLGRAEGRLPLDAELAARLEGQFTDTGQRQAARIALTRRLCLISGGPGTGKTTTLARLIGLLQDQADSPLRIALAAPTGKAAARMGEALQEAGVTDVAPAMTLHRLLGMRPDGGCRHDRERPLAVDLLVVDEASMIDLSLMAHLLDALPAVARLVMLGDRDQLAAVEAGAVFADLCAAPRLADCVASLTTSFRFASASGIGQLAAGLRAGEGNAVLVHLASPSPDLAWQAQGDRQALRQAVAEGYRGYLEAVTAGLPAQVLFAKFRRFRVLCAHRQEVAAVNQAMFVLLAPDLGHAAPGTPLMVTRNDSLLRLHNGDIGLMLPDPADGRIKACFETDDPAAPLRWVTPARLPTHESAWAMTVHKAQGSEFERVLLVLPEESSPVLTRELVYTAVTRARKHIHLWGVDAALQSAIKQRAERMSGLRERLA
jgi:exodeoxyribonuclease V alpha subunit